MSPEEGDDGGSKALGKGHDKVGGDELLLPGEFLRTHEEAMYLLCVLGKCWIQPIPIRCLFDVSTYMVGNFHLPKFVVVPC